MLIGGVGGIGRIRFLIDPSAIGRIAAVRTLCDLLRTLLDRFALIEVGPLRDSAKLGVLASIYAELSASVKGFLACTQQPDCAPGGLASDVETATIEVGWQGIA